MEQLRLTSRHDAGQIAARVKELARMLDEQFAKSSPVLVGVLKGSSFLLADLARAMTIPLSCEYIAVSRQADAEILQIDFATAFPIANRPVVLLKDVVHTGVVETYLMTQLAAANASAIQLVAILDKTSERTMDLTVDFSLFSAESGRFVGYGMDAGGQYAHLPYIAEVEGSG